MVKTKFKKAVSLMLAAVMSLTAFMGMLDIIAGKFFIAYAPIESEKFLSMPKELARKYEEKFKYPERFYKSMDGIEAKPYKPVSKDMER